MPMSVTTRTGGDSYPNPFLGPINHTVAIDVNIANLTSDEVDSYGALKPGVPLTAAGALLAAPTASAPAAAVADGGNTGNATIGSLQGRVGGVAETITVTATVTGGAAVGKASVVGSVSGYLGEATVGTLFVSEAIEFLITDGAIDLTEGDIYTIAVTAGATDRLYGVTVESTKLVASNSDTDRVGKFQIAVAVIGMVNRDLVEDILGRALTAQELSGFAVSSGLKITNT